VRVRALLLLVLFASPVVAEELVTVAVASNFKSTATHLANRFLDETGHVVRLSSGSTGKLYSQIVHGAPFDVFLAADVERPSLLEASGAGVYGSRFTYAQGGLVVFSSTVDDCMAALREPRAGHVAIANPATSPYGAAAKQYLESTGLWLDVSPRAVYGENVTQAWQFAYTGNAVVALAARAHMRAWPREPACTVDVPPETHDPIDQQVVLLDSENFAAREFVEFLRSASARQIIEQDGYRVPR
jgi:molybdate transport system substrate-binding protein